MENLTLHGIYSCILKIRLNKQDCINTEFLNFVKNLLKDKFNNTMFIPVNDIIVRNSK